MTELKLVPSETEKALRLMKAARAMREALGKIAALEPELFAFPADWREQIAACAECERYKSHPIQQGICDEHRRPLWARERWDEAEEKRLGYRAKTIAHEAIALAERGE